MVDRLMYSGLSTGYGGWTVSHSPCEAVGQTWMKMAVVKTMHTGRTITSKRMLFHRVLEELGVMGLELEILSLRKGGVLFSPLLGRDRHSSCFQFFHSFILKEELDIPVSQTGKFKIEETNFS